MAESGVTLDDGAARDRVARIETLLEGVETLADPAARETATELVQALLDLYGEGLARLVEHVARRDDGELAEALASDELVSHLLLLHGLHPVPLETRVRGALEEVRPYLESHGGNVELLGVDGGVARLRLEGSCSGCPSSTVTLKLAIEDAIHKAAPDIEGIEAEGAVEPAPAPGLIQLEMAGPVRKQPETDGSWMAAGAVDDLGGGAPLRKEVAGEPVLLLALDDSVYAYRPECPACRGSQGEWGLGDAELACPECGHRYQVRRAGACVDAPDLRLEPVPLLVDGAGVIKVAMGTPA